MTVLASDFTDQLAAWGQAAGAVATFLAVVVALAIATSENRRAKADHGEEARRRAAMVMPELAVTGDIDIVNFGERPIWAPEVRGCEVVGGGGVFWKGRSDGPLRQLLTSGDRVTAQGSYMERNGQTIVALRQLPTGALLDVTITFVDNEGRRWRRTGDSPPLLVVTGRSARRIQLGCLGIDWARR